MARCFLLVGLASVLVACARIGPTAFTSGGKAKTASANADLQTIRSTLERFHLDNGRYPSLVEGLRPLRHAPVSAKTTWHGPYLTKLPLDPWGNLYRYETTRIGGFVVTSLGADGAVGGRSENADLVVTN